MESSERGRVPSGRGSSAMTVIGFATAVAMWGVGYVTHLPGLRLSPPASLPLMIGVMIAGGWVAGRYTGRSSVGVGSGAITSVINLLILGAVLTSGDENRSVATTGLFCVGFVLTGALIGGVSGRVGASRYAARDAARSVRWPSIFAWTTVIATLLLIVIGGVVTSEEAGLAVPDWPNSFGVNMFVYPLSKMIAQNDVFYEHAHRLFGSLVGLTVLTMTIFFWRTERRWLAWIVTLALVLVIVQGLLGGMRVEQADLWTGDVAAWKRTVKEVFDALALDATRLRVVHGVLGQLFFALLVAIAAFTSVTWERSPSRSHGLQSGDRYLALGFVAAIVAQLILGAITRHVARDPYVLIHMGLAFGVAGLGFVVALRRLIAAKDVPGIRRTAAAVALTLLLQVALGFAAYALTAGDDSTAATLVATAHQATGAVILGLATLDTVWVMRHVATRSHSFDASPVSA